MSEEIKELQRRLNRFYEHKESLIEKAKNCPREEREELASLMAWVDNEVAELEEKLDNMKTDFYRTEITKIEVDK
jgi:chromosome segregation ATPase